MRYLFAPILLLLLLPALFGCKKGPASHTVIIDRRDSGAYRLGLEHGRILIEDKIVNEDSVRDFLLDIRARETNIRARLRQSAGDAYIEGFKDYVEQHSDSMAGILF